MGASAAPEGTDDHPDSLDGLVLSFDESMSGYLGLGAVEPQAGSEQGRAANTPIRFDVRIRIPDLGRFLRQPEHAAGLAGAVTFAPLGGTFEISNGSFNLFSVDPATGVREMRYNFRFTAEDGRTYYLHGRKDIRDAPGRFDVLEDMTRLFTTVHRGEDENAPVYGAGILTFKLRDAPKLAASMKVEGARSLGQNLAARAAFLSFAYGALRDEYLSAVNPFYDTSYQNLVIAGKARAGSGVEVPFFLASGTHDKGFPWGDGELFSDVLLVIGDGKSGYRRYAITDRVLNGLELDIRSGVYRHNGALFELVGGRSASFTRMRRGSADLPACSASLDIRFDARASEAVPFPFPLVPKLVRKISSEAARLLRERLPGERLPGIHITPHAVSVRSGVLRMGGEEYEIVPGATYGEAERGAIRNVKEPTLLYGYICAIRPDARASRVQILSRTLRNEPEHWAKDRLDALIGAAVSRLSSAEILTENGSANPKPLAAGSVLFRKIGDPILEINNDHFPTAVFQRRIVEVVDPSGERCLALEEDMSAMRLEAVNSSKAVVVASVCDENKLAALDRVLDETAFDALVEARLAASAEDRARFLIAIKPNFMFAYDKRDRTTYTDPELVGHLVRRLRARGFANIKVVEAQSTYGEYFDKRTVREVADYLGYDGTAGYEVVDMTQDATEKMHLGGKLGFHPVSRVWRDARFRISFAKNKTHAYSYYTLTLKNIYGALPLANKFKEYHCGRGIYETAIEYLKAFPVDFGIIDAYTSADGPFGIFADPAPNETRTVIGGADLVAVDWVGASKMGLDPMISRYMKLAVTAFGKPEIRLAGDANPYRPWLNVPVALALLTRDGMDANYYFGNLLYSAASQMDETHFRHKDRSWHMRLLRKATVPLRRTFFVRTGENPSLANRAASWLLYHAGF